MLPLHPLLADRTSGRALDPVADVTSQELASMLEAARWAPSSRNSQPWRFAVGRRDDETHKRVLATMEQRNQRWAGRAPVLLVGAHLTEAAGRRLPHAAYDLGQAVAYLTIQASSLGLRVGQVAGFDAAALHDELAMPGDVRARVVLAIGRPADPATLPPETRAAESAPRERQPIGSLLLT